MEEALNTESRNENIGLTASLGNLSQYLDIDNKQVCSQRCWLKNHYIKTYTLSWYDSRSIKRAIVSQRLMDNLFAMPSDINKESWRNDIPGSASLQLSQPWHTLYRQLKTAFCLAVAPSHQCITWIEGGREDMLVFKEVWKYKCYRKFLADLTTSRTFRTYFILSVSQPHLYHSRYVAETIRCLFPSH